MTHHIPHKKRTLQDQAANSNEVYFTCNNKGDTLGIKGESKLPHLIELAGNYSTPLFVRTHCDCTDYTLECFTNILWHVSKEKEVAISLSVLNVNKDKKIAELGLIVTSNCHERLDLTLTIKRPEDNSLVFETESLRLGKFEPGQTKYVCLKAKILKEHLNQVLDLAIKNCSKESATKEMSFTIRLHLP